MKGAIELAEAIQTYVLYSKPLLTTEEVAVILGFVNSKGEPNTNRVYELLNCGLLKYAQLGYKKVTRAELNRFIDSLNTEEIRDINEELKIIKATKEN